MKSKTGDTGDWSSANISNIFRGKTTGRDGHEGSNGRGYKSEC